MTNTNWLKRFMSSDRKDKYFVLGLTVGALAILIVGLLGLRTHNMLAMLILIMDVVYFHKIYTIASKDI
jgi:hypothetical protein